MAKGRDSETFGNTPRDLLDSFVGAPAEPAKGGEPPKKARGPKKVTGNTFHSKVGGETGIHRADRANGYFRRGGFVQKRQDGGPIKDQSRHPRADIDSSAWNRGVEQAKGMISDSARAKSLAESKTAPLYKKGGSAKK